MSDPEYATGGIIRSTSQWADAEPTILHIKPDDVVLIGNAGSNIDIEVLQGLKDAIGAKKLFVFAEDIDVQILRRDGCPYCATPDSGCPVHRDGDG